MVTIQTATASSSIPASSEASSSGVSITGLASVIARIAARPATEAIKCLVGDIGPIDRTLRRTDLQHHEHLAPKLDAAFDDTCPSGWKADSNSSTRKARRHE